jgi:iron complex outermembrane receptor protein
MKLIFSILCLGIGILSYSQNNLTGKITGSNGEPIIGADIYTPKFHKGTTTNNNGNYILKNLPDGQIEIVFSSLGYKSEVRTVVFDKESTELNIILEESVFNMDEIIISTPYNKLQSENVMKVERRTMAQLKRNGAATLIQGLENIAGVSQVSTGVSIGKPVIRGLSGNRVLVYTQGVRLENQQYGDEHGLGLNDTGVESVEVIKGPASLLYGSDALGGVLYLNPIRFAHPNTIEAKIDQKYFTNSLGTQSAFIFKSSAEHIKFLTTASYSSHSDYEIPNGNRVTNSRYNEFDMNAGFGFDLKNFTSQIRFNYTLANIGIPEGIEEQTTHISMALPYQKIENYIVSSHNHLYFRNSKLDLTVGYVANNRREFEDEHAHEDEDGHEEETHHEDEMHELEPALHMKLKTLTYDLKYHLPKVKKMETILGVQGLTQTNTNFGEELLIPDASVNDIGILATVSVPWNTSILQGGIRYDTRKIKTESHHTEEHLEEEHEHSFEAIDKSYSSFTASLGLKSTLFKIIESRLNFATGYRAPNLAELTSNGIHHGTNRFEQGNPDLENEQNYQFDLALEFASKHIEFFVNGFYNHINNFIFISPNGEIIDDADVFSYRQNNASLYGGEIGFHLHPHPLDWLHIESSFEMVIGKQDNDDYLPLIPANSFHNTLRAEFAIKDWLHNGYTSLKLESIFDQNKVSDFETPTNGYNLFNVGFGGDVKLNKMKFGVNFSLNNIFDTAYISHLSRLKTDGIQNIGRTIIFGLDFNI